METKARQAVGPSCTWLATALECSGALSGQSVSPELLVLGKQVTELRKSALISERIETWHPPGLFGEAWQRAKALSTDGLGVAWATWQANLRAHRQTRPCSAAGGNFGQASVSYTLYANRHLLNYLSLFPPSKTPKESISQGKCENRDGKPCKCEVV